MGTCGRTQQSAGKQRAWQALFSMFDGFHDKGIARTQSPTNKNYALELPTFGAIVGVSQTEVQWDGLILKEPLSRSLFTCVPGKYAVWMRQVELRLSDFQSLLWSIWNSSANYVQVKNMKFKKF